MPNLSNYELLAAYLGLKKKKEPRPLHVNPAHLAGLRRVLELIKEDEEKE